MVGINSKHFSLRAFIEGRTRARTQSLFDDKEVFTRFTTNLEKMKPTWNAWDLTMSCGINIRRETGELIRMFRMWDERLWNVFVFSNSEEGIRYRDKVHTKLTLKEAVSLTQNYIKEINEKQNARILA